MKDKMFELVTKLSEDIMKGTLTIPAALEVAFNEGYEIGKDDNKELTIYKSSEYKLIRTYSAGVFLGVIESINGKEAVIRNARRIWYWEGAASLSQLAVDGTSKPNGCKFPCAVDRIELKEVIEILDVTEKAKKSIDGVKIWDV